MPPAVRLSDKAACPSDAHGCPACPHPTFGPAVNGSTDVMINKLPAIRLGDPGIHMACCGPNQWKVAKGSPSVYVNKKPLARMGDKTTHCGGSGNLIMGSPNVFADDAAGGALKALLAKLRDLLAGKSADGKYKGKDEKESGSWSEKGGKGDAKAYKSSTAKAKEAEEDLSKDAKGSGGDYGILHLRAEPEFVAAKGLVKFKVELTSNEERKDREANKTVKVKWVKVGSTESKETSVTGPSGKVLEGSFVAPDLAEGEQPPVRIKITAQVDDKPEYEDGPEIKVGAAGLYLGMHMEPDVRDPAMPWPTNEEVSGPAVNAFDYVKSVTFTRPNGEIHDFKEGKEQGRQVLFEPPADPNILKELKALVDAAKGAPPTVIDFKDKGGTVTFYGLVDHAVGEKNEVWDAKKAKLVVTFSKDPTADHPKKADIVTWCWAVFVPPCGRGKKK